MTDIRYLTLQQVAEYLQLPMDTIYRMSAERQLPGLIVFGARTLRVDRFKLQEALDEATSKHTGELSENN